MKKRKGSRVLKEHDFSGGVRGKYFARLRNTIAVVLEPDVAAVYRDAKSVNTALRKLAGLPMPKKRTPKRKTKS
jgi:hypothetical protein